MSRAAGQAGPPAVPPWVPPGRVVNLPGRGEVFARCHDGGGGPIVLLLHGWTASADLQWASVYQWLGERYPFVAMDLRGHGRGLRSSAPFTLEDAADDAAALLRVLGHTGVVAVGFSMGGPVALRLWERHRDLVAGLVLCATALEWSTTPRDRAQSVGVPLLETLLRSRLGGRLGIGDLPRLADHGPDIAALVPWLAAEARRGDPVALADAGRALLRFDGRLLAGRVDVPVGVLCTTADQVVPVAKQRALAEALRAEVIEMDADHYCAWNRPGEFAVGVRRLVSGVAGRRAVEG